MRKTLDGFQGGLQNVGPIFRNLRYADDIILLATSEAELEELLDRLDRVSRRYITLSARRSQRNKHGTVSFFALLIGCITPRA